VTAARVPHVERRSLYGLRRLAADLAQDHCSDGRLLNRLTGHVDSSTRDRKFQLRATSETLARAAEVLRTVLGRLTDLMGTDAGAH
jgi:hypothetical protein